MPATPQGGFPKGAARTTGEKFPALTPPPPLAGKRAKEEGAVGGICAASGKPHGQPEPEGNRMEDQEGDIRIYVACLAAYNAGHLHGRWVDALQTEEAINAAIQEVLKSSPVRDAEEYAIHDHDGFQGLYVGEYESIARVVEIAAFIDERGELGAQLAVHYGDIECAETALEDHYAGQYESVEDFARELTEETTDIPENLAYYIDYERMAFDLAINEVTAIELSYGEVHIFWSH